MVLKPYKRTIVSRIIEPLWFDYHLKLSYVYMILVPLNGKVCFAAFEPAAQPIEYASQPIEPASQPFEPAGQPIESATQPIEPAAQPIEPASQPIEPASQPFETFWSAY